MEKNNSSKSPVNVSETVYSIDVPILWHDAWKPNHEEGSRKVSAGSSWLALKNLHCWKLLHRNDYSRLRIIRCATVIYEVCRFRDSVTILRNYKIKCFNKSNIQCKPSVRSLMHDNVKQVTVMMSSEMHICFRVMYTFSPILIKTIRSV
jgi:hypothetical protein